MLNVYFTRLGHVGKHDTNCNHDNRVFRKSGKVPCTDRAKHLPQYGCHENEKQTVITTNRILTVHMFCTRKTLMS